MDQDKKEIEKIKYENECINILINFLQLRIKTLSPLFEDFLYASALNAKERDSEIGKKIIEILNNK